MIGGQALDVSWVVTSASPVGLLPPARRAPSALEFHQVGVDRVREGRGLTPHSDGAITVPGAFWSRLGGRLDRKVGGRTTDEAVVARPSMPLGRPLVREIATAVETVSLIGSHYQRIPPKRQGSAQNDFLFLSRQGSAETDLFWTTERSGVGLERLPVKFSGKQKRLVPHLGQNPGATDRSVRTRRPDTPSSPDGTGVTTRPAFGQYRTPNNAPGAPIVTADAAIS